METCVWSQAVRAGLRLGEKGPEKSGYFPSLCSIRLASIYSLITTDMRTLMKLRCKCETPNATDRPRQIQSQIHRWHIPTSEINFIIRSAIYSLKLIFRDIYILKIVQQKSEYSIIYSPWCQSTRIQTRTKFLWVRSYQWICESSSQKQLE